MTDTTTGTAPNDALALVDATSEIVAAFVAHNSIAVEALPGLITGVHGALAGLGRPAAAPEPQQDRPSPAAIRKTITPDALISLIDGKPYKTLRRHLTKHGLTPETYRERYGLPAHYPTVCASYSAQRTALARATGLEQPRRKAA